MFPIQRFILALLTGLMFTATAAAGTVDQIRFKQVGTVVVWENGEPIGRGPSVSSEPSDHASGETGPFGSGVLISADEAVKTAPFLLQISSNSSFAVEFSGDVRARLVSAATNADPSLTLTQTGRRLSIPAKTALKPGAPSSQAIVIEVTPLSAQTGALRYTILAD